MHKKLLAALLLSLTPLSAMAQRSCGYVQQYEALSATLPGFKEAAQQAQQHADSVAQAAIENKAQLQAKTTAISAIPVVFHIVLDSARLASIGGITGVKARCDSQIAVLNADYNRGNSDSTLIPYGWKPLFGNVGIRFGLAHTAPNGHGTPGYEIRVTSQHFVVGTTYDYGDVKDSATGGLSAWDPERYLNIWCMYFFDQPTLLGITTPYSWTSGAGGLPIFHRGICVLYNSFGKRASTRDYFNPKFDKGRTLTHEVGHFFGMKHTWGDDPAGSCPWTPGGADDGISDTSPESDRTYGNPVYSIPGGTLYDGCKMNDTINMQPYGIPCLDYMDYTDDAAMHMFTQQQAIAMGTRALAPSGESYTLTQHPELLDYPTAVNEVANDQNLLLYPNPSHGSITLSYNEGSAHLNNVVVLNMLGQRVAEFNNLSGSAAYTLPLNGLTSGIYFVHCNFASGLVVRKIVLQ